MNSKIKMMTLMLVLFAGIMMSSQKVMDQDASVSFQVFYNELSPYGTWVDNPEYGYVWVPNVDPGFVPYATNGYWVTTDEGWTWVSGYPWGWAPFHYGRWYHDQDYGPIWVPGNEWGPGWVTWRRSEGYYGWAPIGPGISIVMAYGNDYNVPNNQWTFVHDRDLGRRNINNYYINSTRNITIIHNSTVISNERVDRSRNVTYNAGPERAEVEKHAGKKFVPVAIHESSKPGQNLNKNELQIYRPQVQKTMTAGPKPAPVRVSNIKEVKQPAQRSAGAPALNANPQEIRHPLPPVHTGQPPKGQQPAAQPVKQAAPQHQAQPAPQQHQAQPTQQQHKAQPAPQQHQAQPTQQQHQAQPVKQQPAPQQHQAQPAPQQHQAQPAKQQPAPQQHQAQPTQQQHQAQPPKQQSAQPHESQPPQKTE